MRRQPRLLDCGTSVGTETRRKLCDLRMLMVLP